MADKVPGKAWVVVFAGTAVNLCLGILYAWSVWSKALINESKAAAGAIQEGLNAGWPYLTNSQAADPFMICIIIFTLLMIPGGKIQDKLGPKVGAITGGLFLALGCIIAGLMKSYGGLIFGFGILGGIGMGIGYAAPTPAALKWFGPHKRGLVAGIVVGGYGGAALYVSPLGAYLLASGGLTYSFVVLGILFAVVTMVAGSLLAWPEPGYVPPGLVVKAGAAPAKAAGTMVDWAPSEIVKTWQFYALVFMFITSTQSGLMIISIASPLLAGAAKAVPFLVAQSWLLVSYGGLVNASGRVCSGLYSDKIGRGNAYALNCIVSAICMFLMPSIVASKILFFLFVAVGIAYWQYGGGLSLMPSFTADFFGAKNLGMNYGLVFLGWGGGFFMAKIAGIVKDKTGAYDLAFYMSGVVLIIGVIVSRLTKRPILEHERKR
ncbi:MAG: OFA family MFS transporter [Desulfobaccales bacterium]|jgi:OFA family oxalate/formate antiporter-like MFS transporter